MKFSKPPFEDGVFIDIYRSILLKNVQFVKVNSPKDKLRCIFVTNKFVQSAISSAYSLHLSNSTPKNIISEFKQQYKKDKRFYYFYIIYRELSRRKSPVSTLFFKLIKSLVPPDNFYFNFKSMEHRFAWDYILMFLSHQELNQEVFAVLWKRYQNILLSCESEQYSNFIYNQYLKEVKEKTAISLIKVVNKEYDFIIKRAELGCDLKGIFEA